jgi:predicted DNA-binding transcriptional regulator AlpA
MQSSNTNIIKRVNWHVNAFCQAHGIGRTLFYEEVKKGEIKPIKIGRRTLVPVSEAKAWQERLRQQMQR